MARYFLSRPTPRGRLDPKPKRRQWADTVLNARTKCLSLTIKINAGRSVTRVDASGSKIISYIVKVIGDGEKKKF